MNIACSKATYPIIVIDKQQLKIKLHSELELLFSELSNDDGRMTDIIAIFISENPEILKQLGEYLHHEKWSECARLVHKIKIRFGYFGLDQILKDLSKWERELVLGNTTFNHVDSFNNLNTISEMVIEELVATRFHQSLTGMGSSFPLRGRNILVAEDDAINAMVFEVFIKETGASVLLATDGKRATEMALQKHPDMIFMDVHMPFFSGLDAIKELRNKGIDCPIISLSASIRLNEKQNSLDAGADDFLIKPVKKEAIQQMLLKYLQ